jgi:hypothetical protein
MDRGKASAFPLTSLIIGRGQGKIKSVQFFGWDVERAAMWTPPKKAHPK